MNCGFLRHPSAPKLATPLAVVAILGALLPSSVGAATGGATRLEVTATSLGTGHATAGVPFNVTVVAQDANGGTATGFTDPVTFASTDPQATVSPASPYTYAGADAGSKDFSVTLKTAGTKSITFSASGLTAAVTSITVDPGVSNRKLVFGQQPSSAGAGVRLITQPQVRVEDQFGNLVTNAPTDVALAIKGGTGTAGATLTCVNSGNRTTTVSGVATFTGCWISTVGIGYKLTATDTSADHVPAYAAADSAAFDVTDSLVYTTQPGGGSGAGSAAQGGVAFANQPKLEVRATIGNTSTKAVDDSTTSVTLTIRPGTGASGATLTCDGGNSKTAAAGVIDFAGRNCRIDKAGTGYQLAASTPALGSAVWYSATFNVVAGPATKLTFVSEPTTAAAGQAFATQPVVAITDAGGNIVTGGVSANVTLSIGSNPGVPAGVLMCTPSNSVAVVTAGANAGRATFSGCKITNAGVGYTLVATPTSVLCSTGACATPGVLAGAVSSAFTVSAPGADISVTPSSSVITWGGTVNLNVHFAVNGAAKTFALQAARDGVTWSTIAPALVTDGSGNYSFPYRPATNNYYRVVFGGAADLAAANSNTTRVVVRQIALLRPTNHGLVRSVAAGTKVTFTTTVRPARPELAPATVTFRIYRLVSGRWTFFTKRDHVINSAGVATMTWTFTSRGQWYVRSIANPTPYNANSVWSPVERYRVF